MLQIWRSVNEGELELYRQQGFSDALISPNSCWTWVGMGDGDTDGCSLELLAIPDVGCSSHTNSSISTAKELGVVYASAQRYREAEQCLRIAANFVQPMDPFHCTVMGLLCALEMRRHNSREGVNCFTELADDSSCLARDKAAAHIALGSFFLANQWDVQKALNHFEEATMLSTGAESFKSEVGRGKEAQWGPVWLTRVLLGQVATAAAGFIECAASNGEQEAYIHLVTWTQRLGQETSKIGMREEIEGAQRLLLSVVKGDTFSIGELQRVLARGLMHKGSLKESAVHVHCLWEGTSITRATATSLRVELALLLKAPVVIDSAAEIGLLQEELVTTLELYKDIPTLISSPLDVGVRGQFLLAYQGLNNVNTMTTITRLLQNISGHLLGYHAPHLPPQHRNYSSDLRPAELVEKEDGPVDIELQRQYTTNTDGPEDDATRDSAKLISVVETGEAEKPTRLQIGFLSAYFSWHSVGRLSVGLVEQLCKRNTFDIFIIRTREGKAGDPVWARMEAIETASHVLLPRDLKQAQQATAGLNLHALVFCDVGMDGFSSYLAHGRYSPIQIAFWGHPSTTTLPSIDYFITSDLFEPRGWREGDQQGDSKCKHREEHPYLGQHMAKCDGDNNRQERFTEQLVRLGGITTVFDDPMEMYQLPLPLRIRQSDTCGAVGDTLCIEATDLLMRTPHPRLYVCAQSLAKMHPKFDAVLAGVLVADPLAHVVLLRDPGQLLWHSRFQKRLQQAVLEAEQDMHNAGTRSAANPVSPNKTNTSDLGGSSTTAKEGTPPGGIPLPLPLWDRVRFVSPMPSKEFFRLQCQAAVVLDPFPFGGGVTMLESLGCGTPVVTAPSLQSVHQLAAGMLAIIAQRTKEVGEPGLGILGSTAHGEGSQWHRHPLLEESLIATTVHEYIEKAVAVAQPGIFRDRVLDVLRLNRGALFTDAGVVEDWEHFLKRAAAFYSL